MLYKTAENGSWEITNGFVKARGRLTTQNWQLVIERILYFRAQTRQNFIQKYFSTTLGFPSSGRSPALFQLLLLF